LVKSASIFNEILKIVELIQKDGVVDVSPIDRISWSIKKKSKVKGLSAQLREARLDLSALLSADTLYGNSLPFMRLADA